MFVMQINLLPILSRVGNWWPGPIMRLWPGVGWLVLLGKKPLSELSLLHHGLTTTTTTSSLLYANVNLIRRRATYVHSGCLCVIINYEKQLNRDKRCRTGWAMCFKQGRPFEFVARHLINFIFRNWIITLNYTGDAAAAPSVSLG